MTSRAQGDASMVYTRVGVTHQGRSLMRAIALLLLDSDCVDSTTSLYAYYVVISSS